MHERDRAVGLLRDVIERFAADGGDRRRRAEHEQHLFLRGAERNLLERAVGQHIAALECFAGAAGQRQREREQHAQAAATGRRFRYAHELPHILVPTCFRPPRAVPPKPRLAICRPSTRCRLRTWVNLMILAAFRRSSQDRTIRDLYGAIVAQARSPAFYSDYGVPDTVQGRFDLIVLHLVLLLRRLGRSDRRRASRAGGLGQKLFDVFCRDLDGNLREMGVGDLAVPKRMRRFGEAFYGRQAAYGAAFAAADDRELEKALARNIFPDADGDGRAAGSRVMRAPRCGSSKPRRTPRSSRGEGRLSQPEAIAHA